MIFNFFTTLKNDIFLIFEDLINLVYKRKCINCGCSIPDDILCNSCSKTVQNTPLFKQGLINNYPFYSVFYYEGIIKKIIHELKFKHNKICAHYLALYVYNYLKEIKEKENINFENTIIIPVLTHKKNYNKRGYDNVLEIAKELSVLIKCEINSTVLKKIKFTKPQYSVNAKQRKSNIEGSFELDKNFKTDKLVILLDDILTTGSTLEYITSLFRKNEINNLICLTVSKTKFDRK